MNIWRWIAGVLGVLLIIVALRMTYVQTFVGGAGETFSGWVDILMGAPERARLVKLQNAFLRNNMSLKPHQTDYVYEVTSSIDKVRLFYSRYCLADDKNPYLFGNNLMKFCSDINQTGVLDPL
ncbi:hypothetical protein ACFO4O_09730 [Glaciecola siphonariae]|uniref:Uncharacterized protein n=1 Tax=Glaciecola siphonariae TaxID=521012 RepID=A0ABV9LV95_9ALTE